MTEMYWYNQAFDRRKSANATMRWIKKQPLTTDTKAQMDIVLLLRKEANQCIANAKLAKEGVTLSVTGIKL
jgi:hypothetical protein